MAPGPARSKAPLEAASSPHKSNPPAKYSQHIPSAHYSLSEPSHGSSPYGDKLVNSTGPSLAQSSALIHGNPSELNQDSTTPTIPPPEHILRSYQSTAHKSIQEASKSKAVDVPAPESCSVRQQTDATSAQLKRGTIALFTVSSCS
jgi:hypothetical protein